MARILVLYESGFDMVCLKTNKPIGITLRRYIVANPVNAAAEATTASSAAPRRTST